MNRSIILILSFFFISFNLQAEDFYVLHIKGQIIVNSGEKTLKLGDKLTDQDKVKFIDKEAVAVVMSSTRGRLRLENKKESTQSELTYLVQNISNPTKGTLSTRGAGEIYSVKDLQEHVKGESYPIIDSCEIMLPRKPLITDGSYYYFKYEYDSVIIHKKFTLVGDKIQLGKELYNTSQGNFIQNEAFNGVLMYYSAPSEQHVPIEQFNPLFIEKSALIEEINTFIEIQKLLQKEYTQSFDDVLAFTQEIYGNIDRLQLKSLYQGHINK